MGLALSGIIALQGYWLYQSYQQEAERLKEELNVAIRKADEKFVGKTVLSFFITPEGEQEVFVRPYLFDPKEGGVSIQIEDEKKKDTDIIIEQPKNNFQYNYSTATDDRFRIVERHKKRVIELKVDPKKQTWYLKDYDKLLQQELNDIGITEFAYTYWSPQTKQFGVVGNEELIDNLDGKGITLHSKSPTLGATKIQLFLPQQNQLALNKMAIPLLGSLILILLTGSCFAYSLFLIFSQKKLSEIKSDFINNMTHEFKTPISTVSLALEALLKFDIRKDEEKALQYLQIAEGENQRLGLMVEKVLNVAASEKRELKLKKENINFHELVLNATQQMEMQIHEKGGKIHCHLDAIDADIIGDQVHLTNVIYNLIDNACKYTQNAPIIEISSENVNGHILVHVKDNGIGIPSQHQNAIFEKFYRIPTGNVHNVKGFGLGLSYVSLIVQKHLGELGLQSKEGQGSTFSIAFPIRTKHMNETLAL